MKLSWSYLLAHPQHSASIEVLNSDNIFYTCISRPKGSRKIIRVSFSGAEQNLGFMQLVAELSYWIWPRFARGKGVEGSHLQH